jgi:hypothetical protein
VHKRSARMVCGGAQLAWSVVGLSSHGLWWGSARMVCGGAGAGVEGEAVQLVWDVDDRGQGDEGWAHAARRWQREINFRWHTHRATFTAKEK